MTIHTDGGCVGNPGPGAWAYVTESVSDGLSNCGYERATTNNRMELQAVIEALKAVSARGKPELDSTVEVVTDSRYVEGGIVEWIQRWKANGWRTKSGAPVKNQELWQDLQELKRELEDTGYSIEFRRIRGHSGIELNEACHQLVTEKIAAGQTGRQ